MAYHIDPLLYGSVFAVPSVVVDKYIKIATDVQIKTLLWVIRNAHITQEQAKIAAIAIDERESEVKDAFLFWTSVSVLHNDDKSEKKAIIPAVKEKVKKITETLKPTRAEAVRRASDEKEFKILFDEVQMKLGRTITGAEMTTLVYIHDTLGIPPAVILMVIGYSQQRDKKGFAYIEKICKDWAENEIFTVTQAEEKLNELYLMTTAWRIVAAAFGIEKRKPTSSEEKLTLKWVNEFGYGHDILKAAYDNAVDAIGKVNFRYIDKILSAWHKDGVKKPADIQGKEKKPTAIKKKSSIDLDLYRKKLREKDET